MDRRGTERVGQSGGEGEGNVAKRGQAVTEVGQNQDRISNATDNVPPPLPATPLFFFTRINLAALFAHFGNTYLSGRYNSKTRWAQSCAQQTRRSVKEKREHSRQ